MSAPEPPPLPPSNKASQPGRRLRFPRSAWIGLCLLGTTPILLRLFGLIIPFHIPTGAMTPAFSPGDHVMMEDFSYHFRHPHVGDVMVFKTSLIQNTPDEIVYVKRLAGLPGDRVRITEGKLFVNDQHVPLITSTGAIHYVHMPGSLYLRTDEESVTVPAGSYLVLGDNSSNSADSRFWGFLPAEKVMGRISFCYWPPQRVGFVK